MKKRWVIILLLFLTSLQMAGLHAQQRFPKPEFESGHTQPPTVTPEPRDDLMGYLDVFVLVVSLSVMTWLVLKKRSRLGVFFMTIFSLAYFGFYREGCVCAVGSLQNVTLALFNPDYTIPVTVIIFFTIPILFTLFFGRTFCAGICPLGAIQDLFLFQPISMKKWLRSALGLIPYIYLGLAILYAATATDFIICRYDPFVGIFRFDGTFMMFAIGGALLLMGIFIGRPYCRFFCPYGVILNLVSRISGKHLTITPSNCIQCRLCEDSCPYDAIDFPSPEKLPENRRKMVRRFIILSLIIPLLIFAGGWTGARFHENLAKVNPKVRLAEHLLNPDKKYNENITVEIDAFRSSGRPVADLYAEAAGIMDDFYTGGWILGGFIGLVFGLTLTRISRYKYRTDYTPNKGNCYSCARCVDYCPVEPENTNQAKL